MMWQITLASVKAILTDKHKEDRVSSTMKPLLTDNHKEDRLKWCLRMLDPRSIPHDPVFQGLFDYVYIDEKWYNISKTNLKYYAAPGEQQPIRTCKNNNFIPKIMILTVVARPRFDFNGNCTFDGKIGCFAFVAYVPAKRSSANRPAGTIEMKAIDSVTKDVMRAYMIEKVLPAIRAKWPREDIGKPIYIQQDNAKSHISPNDKLFLETAKQDGFDIRLCVSTCIVTRFEHLRPWILQRHSINSIQNIGPNNTRTRNCCGEGI